MADDLAFLDATAQAEMVRQGEVSPRELVDAAIARIERLNPQLNAVIHTLFDKAQAAADHAPAGPFRGVPYILKDGLSHSAGDPHHEGMRFLRDANWVEPEDTFVVARLRAAGFIFCGKSNLPELATANTTEPLAYGPTHNPWDLARSPSGSSGGSAAAVASGMVAAAHGTDMGGSIRTPASCCGLVGLKPSRGRSSLGPDHGEYWGPVTHQHALTRTVRDCAAILDVICGAGPGDPYTAPPPSRPFADEVGADPGALRVAVRTMRFGGSADSHPDCVAAVLATAQRLQSLGHRVGWASVDALDDPAGNQGFVTVLSSAVARDLDRWGARVGREITEADVEPLNWLMASGGRAITAVQYVEALETMQAYTRKVTAAMSGFDILVTPTLPEPPFPLGELRGDAPDLFAVLARMGDLATFTVPFNITGQPAVSLPVHWNDDGLPIGVQLVAHYGREDVLLRVAAQLEEAVGWTSRRPAVHA
jgi:amidase